MERIQIQMLLSIEHPSCLYALWSKKHACGMACSSGVEARERYMRYIRTETGMAHSQLTTSHHSFRPLCGLNNQQDQRLQRSTFRKVSIISGYCLWRHCFFSSFSLKKEVPVGVITGHISPTPSMTSHKREGVGTTTSMGSLINIFQKP